ncbi:MAG TPA: asparagine synthase (glutamine-hydrolyzing) [Gemmatimonadales bacterium]|nr:asparagine synthase (glutamine-hydrolyzing) [Gemmatimonadales bacterium]
MCGFAGLAFTPGREVSHALLHHLGASLAHRGPDGEGIYADDGAAIVHRRLAIIDLSTAAGQPFERHDHGAVLAFNGEIYNFRDLRARLEREGVSARTDSDTEVLLLELATHGPEALADARGMFALALWEPVRRRLTLARDPLGKKPLFYARRPDGAILFASSLECILAMLGHSPALNADAVAGYFANLVVPGDITIYDGVARVPPGTFLRFVDGVEVRRERYWNPPLPATDHRAVEPDELEHLLRQAVRRRFVADVPVGAFLSAGKDSGLVAALAVGESPDVLRTFSAGTTGYEHDERADARLVAELLRTRHGEVEVPAVSASTLPALLRQVGEPFADASLLPSAAIAAAARSHVSVVLTGDGGDELFYGYSVFNGVRAASRVRRVVPQRVLRALRQAVGDGLGRGWRNKLDALLQYSTEGMANRMGWDPERRGRLLRRPGAQSPEAIYDPGELLLRGMSSEDALRHILLRTWLPSDYLVKVDIASMASGLEARCPFLDLDVVEFALRIPSATGFRHGRNKLLLTPLVQKYLPPAIHRRPKTGFGVPVRAWLLGPLRPAFEKLVLGRGRAIQDWINPEVARAEFQALESGGVRADRLWALLVFGLWMAERVEQDGRAAELLGAA